MKNLPTQGNDFIIDRPSDEKLKEIACAINPAYWGKGYASGAVRLFLDWLGRNFAFRILSCEICTQGVK